MPGTNLTREEAQQRAKLLTVDSYEIDLDLTGAQEGGTYRSVTTVRFDVAETGAESFIDLVAPAVHEARCGPRAGCVRPARLLVDNGSKSVRCEPVAVVIHTVDRGDSGTGRSCRTAAVT